MIVGKCKKAYAQFSTQAQAGIIGMMECGASNGGIVGGGGGRFGGDGWFGGDGEQVVDGDGHTFHCEEVQECRQRVISDSTNRHISRLHKAMDRLSGNAVRKNIMNNRFYVACVVAAVVLFLKLSK